MNTKAVEATFTPDAPFKMPHIPDAPSAPALMGEPPETETRDATLLAEQVKSYAKSVERFEREVDEFDNDVAGYADEVRSAYEDAELPAILAPFFPQTGSLQHQMALAGFLPAEEVVIISKAFFEALTEKCEG